MKVLHVIDRLNPGGAERVCIDLANILLLNGHVVGILILLSKAKLDTSLEPGVSTHYLNRTSKLSIGKYKEAAKICREYDIIHVHMRHVYRYMVIVKLIGGFKSKLIFHDHFGDIRTDKSRSLFFNRWFKPTFYIGVSNELTQWAIEKLGCKPHRVFLLANIVRPIDIQEKDKVNDVVIVSNVRPTKNIEFAIQVVAPTHLKLDIIGQIVDRDYYQNLLKLIQELGMDTRVRFITDCYAVQRVLGNYKIALHTAKSETGPLVLMEYLAQGLNFISFQTGEVAEALEPLLPVFFLNSFDKKIWENRLHELLQQPVDEKELKQIFKNQFGEQQYYKKCITIYQKVLHS